MSLFLEESQQQLRRATHTVNDDNGEEEVEDTVDRKEETVETTS